MADLTGENLGPFEIRSVLGTGGFAVVYQAHDPRLDSDVAIKVLAENHSLDLYIRRRFIREAQALRRVKSMSIIGIHDIQETSDGRPYMVMELAERGTLARRCLQLKEGGWQPEVADAICLIDTLAEGLDALHVAGLVHRDIGPSNVLIRVARQRSEREHVTILQSDEQLAISDLGLVTATVDTGPTLGGGTIGFASPEQQQTLAEIDHRSDIFSASALLVWFLTGKTVSELPDWPPILLDDGWPQAFTEALRKGLANDPQERQQSIGEWQSELQSTCSVGAAAAQSTQDSGRSWPIYAFGFAAIAAVVVGATVLYQSVLGPSATTNSLASSELGTSSTTSVVESEAQVVDTPDGQQLVPTMDDLFFDRSTEQVRLGIAWGMGGPDGPIISEVQIAVDGGAWVTQIETELDEQIVKSEGWFLLTTAFEDDWDWIATSRTYSGRVRWVYEDGSSSDWSETMVLEAES